MKEQFPNKKVNIVFGCGGDRDKHKRPKMGKIANLYCSKIYLTDDNPRYESPQTISTDINKNISSNKDHEIQARTQAISIAIEKLKSNVN